MGLMFTKIQPHLCQHQPHIDRGCDNLCIKFANLVPLGQISYPFCGNSVKEGRAPINSYISSILSDPPLLCLRSWSKLAGVRTEGRLRFLTMAYFEQPFQVERVLPNLKSAVECLSATLACFQNPYLYCRGLAITHTPPPCHSTWAKQSLPAERRIQRGNHGEWK